MDEVPKPPAVEEFSSPSGAYSFVLYAPEDWQSEAPEGELFRRDGGARTSLWRRSLPQEYRARFALVSDQGRVAMLDDWWNTRSGFAVVVVGPDGKDVAIRNFEAVRAALGVSTARLVAAARHGPWISAQPGLGPDGRRAEVPAAGKRLVIDLEDGALSAAP